MVKTFSLGFWNPYETSQPTQQHLSEKAESCVICGLELGDGQTYSCPHCGCIGHSACFDDWLLVRKTCPLCRRGIAAEAV
ncbi:MAG: RING-H2 finger protein [Nitrososphaerota archaeon]